MSLIHIIVIGRAARFSPHSVEKDAAILAEVCQQLRGQNRRLEFFDESHSDVLPDADVYVTMGRDERVLDLLSEKEQSGKLVVNATAGIRLCCHRSRLENQLSAAGIPLPTAAWGNGGFWLKRGDAPVQTAADVVFVPVREQLEAARQHFHDRGISDVVESPHVEGDLVKFYGVAQSGFFEIFYPGDDGDYKLGHEHRNGRPSHYPFSRQQLLEVAEKAAATCRLTVYGGDAIVRPDGSFCIIDFNDWPSFARCRATAAEAIARRIIQMEECHGN